MELKKQITGTHWTMILKGKFTFSDNVLFKKFFPLFVTKEITHLNIDCRQVEFIDSAALGILLLLRTEALKHDVRLTLINPSGQMKRMFEIAHFYELFAIAHEKEAEG